MVWKLAEKHYNAPSMYDSLYNSLSNFSREELAIAWVDFLLSPKGMDIIAANVHLPVIPAINNDITKLPEALRRYVK